MLNFPLKKLITYLLIDLKKKNKQLLHSRLEIRVLRFIPSES